MAPQKLFHGRQFSCHFMEAEPSDDGDTRQPLQQSASFPAPAPRACRTKYGEAPQEQSSVIPPMKRRLITLSTAGNLKISPLSSQQLHQHHVYPLLRSSDCRMDTGRAFVMAPRPDRRLQRNGSGSNGERKELSPRADNIAAPITVAPAAAALDGVCGTRATHRLVLRPVRPMPERSEGPAPLVTACDAAWPGNSAALHDVHRQLASTTATDATAPFQGDGGSLQDDASWVLHSAAASVAPAPPLHQHQCIDFCQALQRKLPVMAKEGPEQMPRTAPALKRSDSGKPEAGGGGAIDAVPIGALNELAVLLPQMSIEVTVAVRSTGRGRRHWGTSVAALDEVRSGYTRGPSSGVFDVPRYLAGRDCIHNGSRWMSRSHFEKVGGSTMAKWYRSIRVLPDLEPLGDWLDRHGLPVMRGPARRSRKRPAAESGDEQWQWQAQEVASGSEIVGNASGAATATAAVAGGLEPQDKPGEACAWANRMLLQRGDGGGGDDGLVQRLLSTWPLSQQFVRQPPGQGEGCMRSSPVGAYGCARLHQDPQLGSSPTDPLWQLGDAMDAEDVGQMGPLHDRWRDTAPHVQRRLQIVAPQGSFSHPHAVGAFPTAAAEEKPRPYEDGEQAGVERQQCHPQPQQRQGLLLRPSLLLHRATPDGHMGSGDASARLQPYLFAVQAPPAMLYRQSIASPAGDATAAPGGVGGGGGDGGGCLVAQGYEGANAAAVGGGKASTLRAQRQKAPEDVSCDETRHSALHQQQQCMPLDEPATHAQLLSASEQQMNDYLAALRRGWNQQMLPRGDRIHFLTGRAP
uniref:RlsA n=1 Tax=Yamagishiella unicocca TaxID=51707 RepID=A0A1W6R6N5_9CHLO|nr:RlsA [Yamagishiella unicocca]